MRSESRQGWLPERRTTADRESRRLAIELADIDPEFTSTVLENPFGGKVVEKTRFEIDGIETRFGVFKLELDSAHLKRLAVEEVSKNLPPDALGASTADLLARASKLLVPSEIVTPPIAFADAESLCELVSPLHRYGALGTRHAPQFAFGVHLNPDWNLDRTWELWLQVKKLSNDEALLRRSAGI